MDRYIKMWAEGMQARSSAVISSKIQVTGERNQSLGPRFQFARVQVSVEPAPEFEVVDRTPVSKELRELDFPDWFVFGMLDVLLSAEPHPLHKIRVTLVAVEFDPIDTSAAAFRHAGRDAARKVMNTLCVRG